MSEHLWRGRAARAICKARSFTVRARRCDSSLGLPDRLGRFRCGLDGLFAVASFAAFLPSIDISISFWPAAAFRGFLADLAAFAGAAPLPTDRRSASISEDNFHGGSPKLNQAGQLPGWPSVPLSARPECRSGTSTGCATLSGIDLDPRGG